METGRTNGKKKNRPNGRRKRSRPNPSKRRAMKAQALAQTVTDPAGGTAGEEADSVQSTAAVERQKEAVEQTRTALEKVAEYEMACAAAAERRRSAAEEAAQYEEAAAIKQEAAAQRAKQLVADVAKECEMACVAAAERSAAAVERRRIAADEVFSRLRKNF